MKMKYIQIVLLVISLAAPTAYGAVEGSTNPETKQIIIEADPGTEELPAELIPILEADPGTEELPAELIPIKEYRKLKAVEDKLLKNLKAADKKNEKESQKSKGKNSMQAAVGYLPTLDILVLVPDDTTYSGCATPVAYTACAAADKVYIAEGLALAHDTLLPVKPALNSAIANRPGSPAIGIRFTVESAGKYKLPAAAGKSEAALLTALLNNAAVNAEKIALAVDAAAWLVPHDASKVYCGLAGTPNPTNTLKDSFVANFGTYTVGTSIGYCSNTTFAHELGHLMGLSHDPATLVRQGAPMSGYFQTGYGYLTLSGISSNGKLLEIGDIMSYPSPTATKLTGDQYSDPATTCNFINPYVPISTTGPCGDTVSDAATALIFGDTVHPVGGAYSLAAHR